MRTITANHDAAVRQSHVTPPGLCSHMDEWPEHVLDLMISLHDQIAGADWPAVHRTAESLAHAARMLDLGSSTDAAGVVRR